MDLLCGSCGTSCLPGAARCHVCGRALLPVGQTNGYVGSRGRLAWMALPASALLLFVALLLMFGFPPSGHGQPATSATPPAFDQPAGTAAAFTPSVLTPITTPSALPLATATTDSTGSGGATPTPTPAHVATPTPTATARPSPTPTHTPSPTPTNTPSSGGG